MPTVQEPRSTFFVILPMISPCFHLFSSKNCFISFFIFCHFTCCCHIFHIFHFFHFSFFIFHFVNAGLSDYLGFLSMRQSAWFWFSVRQPTDGRISESKNEFGLKKDDERNPARCAASCIRGHGRHVSSRRWTETGRPRARCPRWASDTHNSWIVVPSKRTLTGERERERKHR